MITFLIFAGSLLLLIGFHEAGHFVAAKAFGVYVIEYAIGFGPRLATVKGKETRYSLRAIPFGGYVRMAGEDRREDGNEIPADRLLYRKPPLVRAAISLAGPTVNLLLALVVTIVVIWSYNFPILQVAAVITDAPADEVLLPGDRVLAIDGHDIYIVDQITEVIQRSHGEELVIDIHRAGRKETVLLRPDYVEEEARYVVGAYFQGIAFTNELASIEPDSSLSGLGLRDGDFLTAVDGRETTTAFALLVELESQTGSTSLIVRRGGGQFDVSIADAPAFTQGLLQTLPFADLGIDYRHTGFVNGVALGSGQFGEYVVMMGDVIGGIVSGRVSASETLQGPVGVARLLGEGFRLGPAVFFQLLAFLSLNFGLLNLIPFPGLDGSRVAFALYERIRGRAIPVEREGLIHAIGFLVLIALMVLITYKDLLALFR